MSVREFHLRLQQERLLDQTLNRPFKDARFSYPDVRVNPRDTVGLGKACECGSDATGYGYGSSGYTGGRRPEDPEVNEEILELQNERLLERQKNVPAKELLFQGGKLADVKKQLLKDAKKKQLK